jgi:hypothetical protein
MAEEALMKDSGLEVGGIAGEFRGRVYPCVVGIRQGPSPLHYFGEGTTWHDDGQWIIVDEPDGSGGINKSHFPKNNVAFINQPMFVIEEKS